MWNLLQKHIFAQLLYVHRWRWSCADQRGHETIHKVCAVYHHHHVCAICSGQTWDRPRLASSWVNVSGCNFEQGWFVWLLVTQLGHTWIERSGAGAVCSLIICLAQTDDDVPRLRRHWRSCLPRPGDNVFQALKLNLTLLVIVKNSNRFKDFVDCSWSKS